MSITVECFKKLPLHHQLSLIFPRDLCQQIWTKSLEPKISLLFGKAILHPIKLQKAIYEYHKANESEYILDVILKYYDKEKLQLFGICQEIEEIVIEYLSNQSSNSKNAQMETSRL